MYPATLIKEFIVPNFAGGGSAIFNQDMVRSMGLPSGAKKIGAAGGYIPNFAKSKGGKGGVIDASNFFYLVPDTTVRGANLGPRTIDGQKIDGGKAFGLRREKLQTASDGDENLLAKNITIIDCSGNLRSIEKNNMSVDQVDWLIPHQANSRIINAIAKKIAKGNNNIS